MQGPYIKPSTGVAFCISSAFSDDLDYGSARFLAYQLEDGRPVRSGGLGRGSEYVSSPHASAVVDSPGCSNGARTADGAEGPGGGGRDGPDEAGVQDKYRRPAGKGQNPQTGKSPTRDTPQPSEPAASQPAPEPGCTAKGRVRQWTDQEWKEWQEQTAQEGWTKEKTCRELQREVDALKEDLRLLALISMRHEDELSQHRTETDFILTLEIADPKATPGQEGLLEQLYKMTLVWKKQQEEGKANNSLRLTLFIGLLMYYEVRVQEATSSAESVENLAQQGMLIQVNGNPAWTYRQWDHEKEALLPSNVPPLLDTDLRAHLQTLKASIGAPGALLRFHSSRRLVEKHQSAVTFFLGIGLRDPLALVCYRTLRSLCFNSSNQLLKMRLKPIRMERQPLVRVLQERFPAPPTRSEEQRATHLARMQQQWRKGQGRGKGRRTQTEAAPKTSGQEGGQQEQAAAKASSGPRGLCSGFLW